MQCIRKIIRNFTSNPRAVNRRQQWPCFVLQVFLGNSDSGTVVTHVLIPPIKARYVRLIPVEWHNYISLRMELYGCLGTVRFQVLGISACMT